MLLSPRSFRMKVNGSFYPPSSSGVGTFPTRPDKPSPRRTLRSEPPTEVSVVVLGAQVTSTELCGVGGWPPAAGALAVVAVDQGRERARLRDGHERLERQRGARGVVAV